MKSQRKHRPGYDDGFFMARTDPEREPAPRISSSPLEIAVTKEVGIIELEKAWSAVRVRFDPVRFLDHLTMLEAWRLKK